MLKTCASIHPRRTGSARQDMSNSTGMTRLHISAKRFMKKGLIPRRARGQINIAWSGAIATDAQTGEFRRRPLTAAEQQKKP